MPDFKHLFAGIATRALQAIIMGVPAVERAAQQLRAGSGDDKHQAVLDLVKSELAAASIVTGHDMAHDPDALKAASIVIDAVAAFHSLLARKSAAPPA